MATALFPRRTTLLIVILAVIAVGLGYLKFTSQPQAITSFNDCVQSRQSQIQTGPPVSCTTLTGQVFYQQSTPPQTPSLSPFPLATPTPSTSSATFSLTTDPTTGIHTFTDSVNKFSLTIPGLWTPKTPTIATDPSLTLTHQEDEFISGVIFTPLSRPANELAAAVPNPTPYQFGGWQGTIGVAPGEIPTEVIVLTPIASSSPQLRLTWARTEPDTNPITPASHLHPLLGALRALP